MWTVLFVLVLYGLILKPCLNLSFTLKISAQLKRVMCVLIILLVSCLGCGSDHQTRGLKLKKYFTPAVQSSKTQSTEQPQNKCDRSPQTWAVVVGVNQYRDGRITDLKGAAVDAWTFYHYLTSPFGGKVAKNRATLLVNEEATRANVEGAFGNLKACPSDQVILYFAGHGMPEKDTPDSAFLLVHDSDISNMVGSSISMQKLPDFLSWRMGDTGRLLLIIDACHAGNIQFKATRGLKLKPKAISKNTQKRIRAVNQNLKRLSDGRKGWGSLSATAVDELAEESVNICKLGGKTYPGGVFTCRFIEALIMREANQNQRISLDEVYQHLVKTVSQDTQARQRPQFSGSLSLQEEMFPRVNQPIMIPEIPRHYLNTKIPKNKIKPYRVSSFILSGLGVATGVIFQSLNQFSGDDLNNFDNTTKTLQDYRKIQSSFEFQKTTSIIGYSTAITTAIIGSGLWFYESHRHKERVNEVYDRPPWLQLNPIKNSTPIKTKKIPPPHLAKATPSLPLSLPLSR